MTADKKVSASEVLAALAMFDQLFGLGGKLLAGMRQKVPDLDLRPADPVDEEADRARAAGIDAQAEAVRKALANDPDDGSDEVLK